MRFSFVINDIMPFYVLIYTNSSLAITHTVIVNTHCAKIYTWKKKPLKCFILCRNLGIKWVKLMKQCVLVLFGAINVYFLLPTRPPKSEIPFVVIIKLHLILSNSTEDFLWSLLRKHTVLNNTLRNNWINQIPYDFARANYVRQW